MVVAQNIWLRFQIWTQSMVDTFYYMFDIFGLSFMYFHVVLNVISLTMLLSICIETCFSIQPHFLRWFERWSVNVPEDTLRFTMRTALLPCRSTAPSPQIAFIRHNWTNKKINICHDRIKHTNLFSNCQTFFGIRLGLTVKFS